MSDYTQSTDFSAKDALSTGDPNKVIYGSDVDGELASISTAITTKANKISGANANNVITQTSTGDLQDSGYKFSNLVGSVTTTTAELNVLDGITATTAELNILDGVTATFAELNYLAGATSGTVLTTGDEGTGGGIDADTVDSLHATSFAYRSNNLSDLASAATARTNLGLGSLATRGYLTDFATGSYIVARSINLSPTSASSATTENTAIVGRDGTVNTRIIIKRNAGGVDSLYVRIYVNGVATGTNHNLGTSTTTRTAYNQDIAVSRGDVITVRTTSSNPGSPIPLDYCHLGIMVDYPADAGILYTDDEYIY